MLRENKFIKEAVAPYRLGQTCWNKYDIDRLSQDNGQYQKAMPVHHPIQRHRIHFSSVNAISLS